MVTKKVFYGGRRRTQHKLGILIPGENTFPIDIADKLIALKLVTEIESKQAKNYADKSINNKEMDNKSFSRKGKSKQMRGEG